MRRMRPPLPALALAGACALAAPAAAATACGPDSVLTLVGLDTSDGAALFALRAPDAAWLLEVRPGADTAALHRDDGAARQGASVGPGLPLAVTRCGADCLQPLVWKAGSWQALGEALTAPAAATVHGTWDRGGAPWLVLHTLGPPAPQVRAAAFRFDGREWQPRGALTVSDFGVAGAVPVPDRADAVASGTGLFAAGEPAGSWLHGLPELPRERRGVVYPTGGQSALYLAADGVAYATRDQGRTWARPLWTPWGETAAQAWKPGEDYQVEAPLGAPRLPFALAWLDRRAGGEATFALTETRADGVWKVLARLPETLATGGRRLPIAHLLADDAGHWSLVAGCVEQRGRPAVLLRRFFYGRLQSPRLVPVSQSE